MFDTIGSAPPWIEVLSGLGEKGPACIRVWTGREVWLLDVGAGPEASSPFDPEWLRGADRVLISHDHIDHIGGAAFVVGAGLPIHCTAVTAQALPPGADVRLLPESETTLVAGVKVTTGRNGHAHGGVWVHLALGEGLFFSGDWSEESQWFAFDPPPEAALALIDCSYQLNDTTQTVRKAALDKALDASTARQHLFPVPPSGRAGELALHLLSRGSVTLDDTCRAVLKSMLAQGGVARDASRLEPLLEAPFDPSARYLICDTPNADAGMAWTLVRDWRDQGTLGQEATVIFTGHMTAHARAIAEHGGQFLRWNVHPPLRDQIAMIRRLGARQFAPLFCDRPEDYLLETRFNARLILNDRVLL